MKKQGRVEAPEAEVEGVRVFMKLCITMDGKKRCLKTMRWNQVGTIQDIEETAQLELDLFKESNSFLKDHVRGEIAFKLILQ